ncbi:hypothetical protein GQ649_03985 [Rhodococcus sp. DSM 6344]|nr:hypothetical protein [Rhodococcus erythropolis]
MDHPSLPPREAVLLELDHLRKQQEANRLHRIYRVCDARKLGITNQEIGDTLGITEAAVRAIVKTASKS